MFAALETWDYFWIWAIVSLAVGTSAVSMARLEAKIDLLLKQQGIRYIQPGEQTLPSERRRGIIVGIIAVALLLGFVIYQWFTGK